MNILIVSGHPAQVHNFKHLKWELEKKGHTVFWLASDKDISKYLLNKYNIKFTTLKKGGKGLFSKIYSLFNNTLTVIGFIKKHNIHFAVSRISPYVSIACFLLRKTHIGMTDTETAGKYDTVFGKLLSSLLTATSYERVLRKDQIRFKGNIELFYLHPNRFTPLPVEEVSQLLGIAPGEQYVIMRFVSWDAYHDKGLAGFSDENKVKAVTTFSAYARVFISSEGRIPDNLKDYQISIPSEKMHDVLAHATLFFGESATMASESAVLCTPAIYLNENWLGYINEAAQYNLLYRYKQDLASQTAAIEKGRLLLSDDSLDNTITSNHQAFMKDKIDVTAFLVWFIEHYPESRRMMLEDGEGVQEEFRGGRWKVKG